MRILFSMPTLTGGRGGAERVATELAHEMTSRGHTVAIVCNAEEHDQPAYHLDPRVTLFRAPLSKPAVFRELRHRLAKWKPDIFFMFYFTGNLSWQFTLGNDLGVPIGGQECTNPVRMVRNLSNAQYIESIEEAFLLRSSILVRLQAIRVTMDSYLETIPAIALPQSYSFTNSFPLPERTPDEREQSKRKRLISVGGMKDENKNGMALIFAFANIAGEFPEWDLEFFGANGYPSAQDTINLLKMERRIFIRDSTDDIYAEYAKSDLHAITSYEEGCPNAVCEAMLHGLASVGYDDCPGTNEMIEPGYNGWLASRNIEDNGLEETLRKAMSSPDMRKQFGENARREALQRFNREYVYDTWEKLFLNMSGETKAEFLHRQENLDADDFHSFSKSLEGFLENYSNRFSN